MHIYFSGIGGVGIGPLARIARDIGYEVTGSDSAQSRNTDQLISEGIAVIVGQTTDAIAEVHKNHPIDWFVYTSGLPSDHPELKYAQENGINTAKRDEIINKFLSDKNLKMFAIAGTHGKTNTTALVVCIFKQLGIPVSYSIGSNISYGPNGTYQPGSEFFIYEADEFDRNFLHFNPEKSIFTSVDYDHPDTYPTIEDYKQAFRDFADQSGQLITWSSIAHYLELKTDEKFSIIDDNEPTDGIKLIGDHTRRNAYLAVKAVQAILPEVSEQTILDCVNTYPGTERRMEKLAPNLYSDYAHHPVEIMATLKAAKELGKPVVAVYQPHQNVRQHEIAELYTDTFEQAESVFWLPTYLSREDSNLEILSPEKLTQNLTNKHAVTITDMNPELAQTITSLANQDKTIILMSAGSLDAWARENFS